MVGVVVVKWLVVAHQHHPNTHHQVLPKTHLSYFFITINYVGFCRRTNRQRANHTVPEERGGDYRVMASSHGVLSEGQKIEREGGF